MACGVFAPIFSFFIFFAYLLGLCLCCPWLVLLAAWLLLLVLSSLYLWVVVVSFSLTVYPQKERAQFLASSLVLLCVFPFQIYLISLAKSKMILPFAVS